MLFLAFFITFIEFFGSRICLVFHLWFYLYFVLFLHILFSWFVDLYLFFCNSLSFLKMAILNSVLGKSQNSVSLGSVIGELLWFSGGVMIPSFFMLLIFLHAVLVLKQWSPPLVFTSCFQWERYFLLVLLMFLGFLWPCMDIPTCSTLLAPFYGRILIHVCLFTVLEWSWPAVGDSSSLCQMWCYTQLWFFPCLQTLACFLCALPAYLSCSQCCLWEHVQGVGLRVRGRVWHLGWLCFL